MKINKKEITLTYTNIVFIIPFVIGLKKEFFGITSLLGVFVIFSTLYHLFRKPGAEWWWHTTGRTSVQTFMLLSEIILALILSAWSAFLIYEKSPTLLLISFLIFIPGFIVFLSTNYKRYILYHSIWHAVSSIIITIALI